MPYNCISDDDDDDDDNCISISSYVSQPQRNRVSECINVRDGIYSSTLAPTVSRESRVCKAGEGQVLHHLPNTTQLSHIITSTNTPLLLSLMLQTVKAFEDTVYQ